jgi:hypothetical protein
MTLGEHMVQDYSSLSLSLKAHPIAFFREELTPQGVITSARHWEESLKGRYVRVAASYSSASSPAPRRALSSSLKSRINSDECSRCSRVQRFRMLACDEERDTHSCSQVSPLLQTAAPLSLLIWHCGGGSLVVERTDTCGVRKLVPH